MPIYEHIVNRQLRQNMKALERIFALLKHKVWYLMCIPISCIRERQQNIIEYGKFNVNVIVYKKAYS